jgi:hypothetical protein
VQGAAALKGWSVPATTVPSHVPNLPATVRLGDPVFSSTTTYNPTLLSAGTTGTAAAGTTPAQAAWGADWQGIRGSLAATRMFVNDDASWMVTVNDTAIMDSSSDSLWPGCLRSQGQPPQADGSPSGCDWTNPLVSSLNDILRWCDPGGVYVAVPDLSAPVDPKTNQHPLLSTTHLPLGRCDNTPADGQDPLKELNSLRWRVEGVLWTAAMMAGGVPDSMFTSPVPAANLGAGATGTPINMYLDNGKYTAATQWLQFQNGDGTDNDLLSGDSVDAQNLNANFKDWSSNAPRLVPKWLRDAYAQSSPYGNPVVQFSGQNVGGAADFTNLDTFFLHAVGGGGVHDTSGNGGDHVGPQQWQAIATRLGGLSCPNPYDPPSAGSFTNFLFPLGPHWMQGLVAAIKSQVAKDSDMMKPVYQDHWLPGPLERSYQWIMTSRDGSPHMEFAETISSKPEIWHDFQICVPTGVPWPSEICTQQTAKPALDLTYDDRGPGFWFDQTPLTWNTYSSGKCGAAGDRTSACDDWLDILPANWSTFGSEYPHFDNWRHLDKWTLNDRVRYALNSKAPNGDCGAAWDFTQAIALSCVVDQEVTGNAMGLLKEPPKTLSSVNDLTLLSIWLEQVVRAAQGTLANAYVESVPTMVVANARAVPGSLAGLGGTAGTDLVQASNSLLDVYTQWKTVTTKAAEIADEITGARIAIAQAKDVAQQADIQEAIQKLQTLKAIAEDVAQTVEGMGSVAEGMGMDVGKDISGSAQATAGVVAAAMDVQTLKLIDDLSNNTNQTLADAIRSALNALQEHVASDTTDMTNALISARKDSNLITEGVEQYATQQAEASYYAGKATGSDVWNCQNANGTVHECISHVNTVLNRRYAGQQLRYQAALREAKALGFIARLAIEQRIGERLSDITTSVGPLDAPSTWADDVCGLTGINYTRLRQDLVGIDAGSDAVKQEDARVAGEFANAFIGDYVQKLTDFVQYYNIAYPEADGNDQAVLSLRETLLGAKTSCQGPPVNLLTDSSRLYATGLPGSAPLTGWGLGPCGAQDPTCLSVRATKGPFPTGSGGGTAMSWLSDQAQTIAPPPDAGDGGIEYVTADAGAAGPSGPDNAVSQEVAIDLPGTYVLSWWDQARDPVTGLPSTTSVPYGVAIYDSGWSMIAAFPPVPPAPSDGTGTGWSDRRVLAFKMAQPDVIHVAFSASAPGGQPGSVAIADVQLELSGIAGQPSAYVDTGSTGQATSYECALSPSDMRNAFQRSCDPDGTCHYDLMTPIAINTEDFTSNGASLTGKLAAGNYNYRHVDLAVNVVGTGVIDCSQTGSPDCLGSGYLTYTLTHDASEVGVLGYDGQYRSFDFGVGATRGVKALTSERYITTPIGSSDQQLLTQVMRPELRGRPIDGTYTLRIEDSPVLHFDQIQDIQIILNYHYWSRVAGPQNAPGK